MTLQYQTSYYVLRQSCLFSLSDLMSVIFFSRTYVLAMMFWVWNESEPINIVG